MYFILHCLIKYQINVYKLMNLVNFPTFREIIKTFVSLKGRLSKINLTRKVINVSFIFEESRKM